MCQVSDQIKLCSCKTKNVETLKHYWHIKRKNKETSYIVGELIMPADIGEENDEINMDIILNQLNMGNIFDMDIKHKNNDILELIFSFKADRERFRNFSPNTGDFLAYAFKYRNGQWKKFDYENWVINFDAVEKGKIVNPFMHKKIKGQVNCCFSVVHPLGPLQRGTSLNAHILVYKWRRFLKVVTIVFYQNDVGNDFPLWRVNDKEKVQKRPFQGSETLARLKKETAGNEVQR